MPLTAACGGKKKLGASAQEGLLKRLEPGLGVELGVGLGVGRGEGVRAELLLDVGVGVGVRESSCY